MVHVRGGFTSFLLLLLAVHFIETKARKNCSPLPECCKTFVFSPACRGVAAKRGGAMIMRGNDEYFRDPRASFPFDPDLEKAKTFGNLITMAGNTRDDDEEVFYLNHLMNKPKDDQDEGQDNRFS